MTSEFRQHLARLMGEYKKKDLTVDQIYADAPLRQLELVSICFDICVESIIKQALQQNKPVSAIREMHLLPDSANTISMEQALKSSDFYFQTDIKQATSDELKEIRYQMTSFLEENCGIIFVADGNVKSQKRFLEKISDTQDMSPHDINDLNRLTVVSKDLPLLEMFSENLKDKTTPETFCAKDEWEMKSFGMLSRSNYLFIDGFPAEIHLSEPRQFLLSQTMTHLVYEVLRADTLTDGEKAEFDRLYDHLPEMTTQSIDANSGRFENDDIATLRNLNAELAEKVNATKAADIKTKQQSLLTFHRKAHETFYETSSPEWKSVYNNSKQRYYDGTKDVSGWKPPALRM